ncbi:hypothetical protein KJ885_01730 [Patescibacteria group bacterium]|nr:hypothetical protein [Patescibacteria group bacterium]
MPRRKNENIRSLNKTSSGKAYAVTVPIKMIRELGWQKKQKVVFSIRGKSITIKDWPVKKR